MSDLCLTESQRENIQPVEVIPKRTPEKVCDEDFGCF